MRKKIIEAVDRSRSAQLANLEAVETFVDQQLPDRLSRGFGGNTSCVQLSGAAHEYVLLDAGSGIRSFACSLNDQELLAEPSTFHIFLSHLHWDHIQGFPFFQPAFDPKHRVIFHGHHELTEQAIRGQMGEPWFPIDSSVFLAGLEFDIRPPGSSFSVCGYTVSSIEQQHPGRSYGYRFERDKTVVVYSTDSEHKGDIRDPAYPFIPFFKDADVLIFDAQYPLAEAKDAKADWGHSSNVTAVELAARAQVRTLVLFHHDPASSDSFLERYLEETRRYAEDYLSRQTSPPSLRKPEQILLGYDGLQIAL